MSERGDVRGAGGPEDLEVRPLAHDEAELGATSALFDEVWPEGHLGRHDYLRWLYLDNPQGKVVGANAWAGTVLAAHYAVVPIAARWRGEAVAAALSLNTATAPAYRRRGLFVTLAEATYEQCLRLGMHHVVGVANEASTPGFIGKLGFQQVARLEASVGLGAPKVVSPTLDDVSWQRIWTPEALSWRLKNPVGAYRHARRDHEHFVVADSGILGIKAVLMVADDPDLVTVIRRTPASRSPIRCLWIGLSRRVRPSGVSASLPRRLRPAPLNLIFRPLEGSSTMDAATIEFEAIDFDAY